MTGAFRVGMEEENPFDSGSDRRGGPTDSGMVRVNSKRHNYLGSMFSAGEGLAVTALVVHLCT
jgi:hypothetical protein